MCLYLSNRTQYTYYFGYGARFIARRQKCCQFSLFIFFYLFKYLCKLLCSLFSVLTKCCFLSFFNSIGSVNHNCDNLAINDFCQNSAWMQSWLLLYLFIYLLFKYLLFKFGVLLLGSDCLVAVTVYSYRVVFFIIIIYWFICFLQNVEKKQ